jgi:phosphate starvation-inducible membrane PsiE
MAAFTVAAALALGATGWLWIAVRPDLAGGLHESVDPMMLVFLFAELAHTARVMQSTHHIRPDLIVILASLVSARHLLVLLTVTHKPTAASLWGSAGVLAMFVILWIVWAILAPRSERPKSSVF